MKIQISIEATPEEFREALGLPNLTDVQKIVMEQIAENVKDGNYDINTLKDLLVPKSVQSMGKKFMESAMDNIQFTNKKKKDTKE